MQAALSKHRSFFTRPLFWLSFTVISVVCVFYVVRFFPAAFPMVNVEINIDREEAMHLAEEHALNHSWGPEQPDVAVSFDADNEAQFFIELAGGGQEVFRSMMQEHLYMPYQWQVRRFKEFDANEVEVYLTPNGTLYGFREKIPQDEQRANLSSSEALALITDFIRRHVELNFDAYVQVEHAKNRQPNGRVDHTFLFERSDKTLNEGRYTLKAKVRGDKLTRVTQMIKIPQSFKLHYKEMRSANNTLASGASIFSFIFYLLIGGLLAVLILMRQNWIIWKAPVCWAFIIALLQLLNTLNSLPLMWMYYQTQTGHYAFILQILITACYTFLSTFTMASLTAIAGESLTRKAFGSHVRFWSSWKEGIANSYTLLGQTVGGYLMIAIDMAFLITFYYLTTTYLGWWTPLSQLVNPDVLAHYFPWLSSIAGSLKAGFLEELEFRAIPLAGAALLGRYFGRERLWVGIAFIMQAIIFGAAHANYSSQPAYARLVELIVPSFVFGFLYLRFGLLCSIVMHYAYDVFWMGLPVFLTHTTSGTVNKIIIMLFALLPLIVILYRRYRAGTWQELTPEAYNATWRPTQAPLLAANEQTKQELIKLTPHKRNGLYLITAAALCIIVLTGRRTSDAPPLRLYRADAIALAQKALGNEGFNTSGFEPYARIKPTLEKSGEKDLMHRYVWRTYPRTAYRALLGSYITPPHWIVRFLKFSGPLQERAESHELIIGASTDDDRPSYAVLAQQHTIAESIPGAQLEKKEARTLAEQMLIEKGIKLADIEEISAVPKKLPERIDWTFIFAHKPEPIQEGQARIVITITGDKFGSFSRNIHLPESWRRQEDRSNRMSGMMQMLCMLFVRMLCIMGMAVALIFLSYHRMPIALFLACLGLFVILNGIKLADNFPQIIAQFNTAAPFANQLIQTYGLLFVQHLLESLAFASLLAVVLQFVPRYAYIAVGSSLTTAIAAGLALICLRSCIGYFATTENPLWGYYGALGTALPHLSFLNSHLLKFLRYTASFAFLSLFLNYCTDYGRRRIALAALICLITGCTFSGFEALDAIPAWAATGVATGIMLYLFWFFYVRFCVESIPVAVATGISCMLIQQLFFDVIPAVALTVPICILVIASCAAALFIRMRRRHA